MISANQFREMGHIQCGIFSEGTKIMVASTRRRLRYNSCTYLILFWNLFVRRDHFEKCKAYMLIHFLDISIQWRQDRGGTVQNFSANYAL